MFNILVNPFVPNYLNGSQNLVLSGGSTNFAGSLIAQVNQAGLLGPVTQNQLFDAGTSIRNLLNNRASIYAGLDPNDPLWSNPVFASTAWVDNVDPFAFATLGTNGLGGLSAIVRQPVGIQPAQVYHYIAQQYGYTDAFAMAFARGISPYDQYQLIDQMLGGNPLTRNPFHLSAIAEGFPQGFAQKAAFFGVSVYDLEAASYGYANAAQFFSAFGLQPIGSFYAYNVIAQNGAIFGFGAGDPGSVASDAAADASPYDSISAYGAALGINPFDIMRLADQTYGLNSFAYNPFEYMAVLHGFSSFQSWAQAFGVNEYDAMAQLYGFPTYADFAASYSLGGAYREARPGGEVISGTGLGDALLGSDDADAFNGFGGGDLLSGNGGNDTLFGGADDDLLQGGDGDDQLIGEAGSDAFNGGAGNDILYVDADDWLVIGESGYDTVYVQGGVGMFIGLAGAGLERVVGNAGGDQFDAAGQSAAVVLEGVGGNDSLTGGSGNDTLIGGAGADTMTGGLGNDTFYIDHAGDIVTEALNQGSDIVRATVSKSLAANLETLILDGTAHLNGAGNELANTLIGNAGNNVLDGRVGADRMFGHAGNDTYVVDNVGDLVGEVAGNGTDTVRSSITYTLGNQVENLLLLGSANINGTGNALANAIVGNTGSNRLDGAAGNDSLTGGLGIDYLTGGLGNDNFIYGAVADSAGSAYDRILDFTAGDRIWLNAIDANTTIANDQAFVL
ncbi:MAG: calcium-binding protein, partial [Hyphomicrobiaceae bacterium]|nr:calcium-binding protein [Hyphomicrobiaceae bacterium]